MPPSGLVVAAKPLNWKHREMSNKTKAPNHPDPLTEEQIRAHTIGELKPWSGPIRLVDYDPQWPELYRREAERIQAALGRRGLQMEHVGSTSVPGLAAKPVID